MIYVGKINKQGDFDSAPLTFIPLKFNLDSTIFYWMPLSHWECLTILGGRCELITLKKEKKFKKYAKRSNLLYCVILK